ncbi:MAG: hypothetical protein Q8M16_15035 [Pirellulaceae bacterium]|nr:hypothetical protein [Pirellulaceae bacterium]
MSARWPSACDELPPISQWPSWVDPKTGQVRGVSDSYPGVQLESGTVSAGRDQADMMVQSANNWDWSFEWPEWIQNFFSWWGNLLAAFGLNGWMVLLLLLAVAFLIVIFVILARTDWGRSLIARNDRATRRRKAVAKEELPFELEAANLTVDGLWQHATKAKQQGDFRRALMFLYSYLLIELDAHQMIRLSRGKTNRDYGRELTGILSVYPCFVATMDAFERVFFGRFQLESEQVEELFSQVGRLELK